MKKLALIGLLGVFLVGCSKDKCPDVVTDTWTQVQYLVKKNLKSPSTADFPYPGKENLKFIGEVDGKCSYFIAGNVDSQNGFGATVRSSYEVFVAYYIDSEKWEYIGFSLK